MSSTEFPADVHVLRPRKVSVSKQVDSFLDGHGLVQLDPPAPTDGTRPKAKNLNAIRCVACGQIEYLTRDHCRCGHYLRGQLEDHYLAWEQKVREQQNELLEAIERKLKPLRLLFCLGLPFVTVPMLHMAFWSDSFSLSTFLWMIPAFLIFGLVARIESHLKYPLEASAWQVSHCTLETYLQEKVLLSEHIV